MGGGVTKDTKSLAIQFMREKKSPCVVAHTPVILTLAVCGKGFTTEFEARMNIE